jgi:hypothetical protein
MEETGCRKYDTKYLSFGFTVIDVDGEERQNCLFELQF